METNQNQQDQLSGNSVPKNYGEESRLHEQQSNQSSSQYYGSQPMHDNAGNLQQNYSQPYYQQPVYGQAAPDPSSWNSSFYNGGFGNQQVQQPPVSDIFCYFLLVIIPLRYILDWISTGSTISAVLYAQLAGGEYDGTMAGGVAPITSMLSSLLFIAFIVFVVLDIIKVRDANYKITGLILFALFLVPGYYIWRAHILGRKKTVPIIYTVGVSLLLIGYICYTIHTVVRIVMLLASVL